MLWKPGNRYGIYGNMILDIEYPLCFFQAFENGVADLFYGPHATCAAPAEVGRDR